MKKRAFIKYTKKGDIIPGSLIITTKGGHPKDGLYKEITTSLCCDTIPGGYGIWKVVTGGIAGDGVVLNDQLDNPNRFTIIGPNDDEGTGWVYLKAFFPAGGLFSIDYNWTSFDEGIGVDRPVYWESATEPTGIPDNITPRVSTTPENNTWNITVSPNSWFAVGIYSTDSCCGRGFLQIDFDFTP